jgi:hypothetical protein
LALSIIRKFSVSAVAYARTLAFITCGIANAANIPKNPCPL